jgi:adenylosuccinate synthase
LILERFLGTTKQGIGPTYASKASRTGLRVGDLRDWDSFVTKYRLLHARFQETEKLNIDPEKELANLKETRERFLSEGMIVDTVSLINKVLTKTNKRILTEGANATMLDTDFGTYPYVTSSNTWAAGVSTGLGIPPNKLETRIGIVKAYTTRVGEGPFPTELDSNIYL